MLQKLPQVDSVDVTGLLAVCVYTNLQWFQESQTPLSAHQPPIRICLSAILYLASIVVPAGGSNPCAKPALLEGSIEHRTCDVPAVDRPALRAVGQRTDLMGVGGLAAEGELLLAELIYIGTMRKHLLRQLGLTRRFDE